MACRFPPGTGPVGPAFKAGIVARGLPPAAGRVGPASKARLVTCSRPPAARHVGPASKARLVICSPLPALRHVGAATKARLVACSPPPVARHVSPASKARLLACCRPPAAGHVDPASKARLVACSRPPVARRAAHAPACSAICASSCQRALTRRPATRRLMRWSGTRGWPIKLRRPLPVTTVEATPGSKGVLTRPPAACLSSHQLHHRLPHRGTWSPAFRWVSSFLSQPTVPG